MVVGGVAMAPLSMAIACRHTLHPLATCALFQTAASGIAVSVAASKPLQAHTTQMLGKVLVTPQSCTHAPQCMHSHPPNQYMAIHTHSPIPLHPGPLHWAIPLVELGVVLALPHKPSIAAACEAIEECTSGAPVQPCGQRLVCVCVCVGVSCTTPVQPCRQRLVCVCTPVVSTMNT